MTFVLTRMDMAKKGRDGDREDKNAELIRQAEEKARLVSEQLLTAEEEERSRIASELHDDLGQTLSMLEVDMDRLLQQVADDPLRETLVRLKSRIAEVTEHIREMAHELHPAALDDLGLPAALRSFGNRLGQRERFSFVMREKGVHRPIARNKILCLYRVGQEAIKNAAKHAETKRVIARLITTDRALVLSVTDYGRGFDPAAVERRPTGLGLKIMHERLRLVGGSLAIRSIPGRGTRLRAWVPFGEAR
jgi:two-component system sensor histidine kinase NreB